MAAHKANMLVKKPHLLSAAEAWPVYRSVHPRLRMNRQKFMRVYNLLRQTRPGKSIRSIYRVTRVATDSIKSVALFFDLRTKRQTSEEQVRGLIKTLGYQ